MYQTFDYFYTVAQDDIDELEHAGNYHYLRWTQAAAVAHSSANGWSPEDYIRQGAGWVAHEHHIKYLKPAFLGDDIKITTWISKRSSATSERQYRVYRVDGTVLARATTIWAFMNYKTQRPTRIPTAVANCFELVENL